MGQGEASRGAEQMSLLCVPDMKEVGCIALKLVGQTRYGELVLMWNLWFQEMRLNGNKTKQLSTGVSVSSSDMYWQQWVLPRGLGHRIALLCY